MAKILLPIDVEHPHDELIASIDKVVPLKGSTVKLLYVTEELPSFESIISTIGDFPDDWRNLLVKKVNEKFDQIEQKLTDSGATVTREIASGPPASVIASVAKDEGFDFIALPAGSNQHAMEFLLGSTTGRVVSKASNTVLIVRAGIENLKHIVIGVDGSDESLKAAQDVVQILALSQREIKISLVNVVSVAGVYKFISPVQFVASIEDNLMMSGEVVLATAEKTLADMGCKNLEVQLKNGDPATEIMKYAHESGAQLIVVAAQGRSALEKFLMGTVSGRIASHAKCSVAVIR
jgi:nucleotide-binding universal stress UspA family protein